MLSRPVKAGWHRHGVDIFVARSRRKSVDQSMRKDGCDGEELWRGALHVELAMVQTHGLMAHAVMV